MATIDELVRDFLAQKRIAVAGVSATHSTTANVIYRKLKSQGHEIYPVGASGGVFDGDEIHRNVASLPVTVDAVLVVTRPAATLDIVKQCVATGVKRVWMHDMMGTHPTWGKGMSKKLGSVSQEAVLLCRANGIAVIAGSCPMQFVGDIGHKCMRGLLRLSGSLQV